MFEIAVSYGYVQSTKRISSDDLRYTLNYKFTDVNEYFQKTHLISIKSVLQFWRDIIFQHREQKSPLILAIASTTQLLITVFWHIFLYIKGWSNKRGKNPNQTTVKHIADQRSDGFKYPHLRSKHDCTYQLAFPLRLLHGT